MSATSKVATDSITCLIKCAIVPSRQHAVLQAILIRPPLFERLKQFLRVREIWTVDYMSRKLTRLEIV